MKVENNTFKFHSKISALKMIVWIFSDMLEFFALSNYWKKNEKKKKKRLIENNSPKNPFSEQIIKSF